MSEPTGLTRRQQILELLSEGEWGFEELRAELATTVRFLEDDLRHVERTLRGRGRRLVVVPARCRACGFVFRGREAKHLHTPSRCPRCREEQLDDARFRVGG